MVNPTDGRYRYRSPIGDILEKRMAREGESVSKIHSMRKTSIRNPAITRITPNSIGRREMRKYMGLSGIGGTSCKSKGKRSLPK
jgi:hypothetical protein